MEKISLILRDHDTVMASNKLIIIAEKRLSQVAIGLVLAWSLFAIEKLNCLTWKLSHGLVALISQEALPSKYCIVTF